MKKIKSLDKKNIIRDYFTTETKYRILGMKEKMINFGKTKTFI
jgi:hypothetical protein